METLKQKNINSGTFKNGHKPSAETVAKISASLKGKPAAWISSPRASEIAKKISLSKKGKPSLNQRGEKNWRWKGGITSENQKIRHSLEYKLWRTSVFERDGYMCIWGGVEHGNKLEADHIKPFYLYPELRFAIDNGRTLCVSCHRKVGTSGRPKKHG